MPDINLGCVNTIKIEMVLTDKEFHWLRELLLKPLYEDETNSERMMRTKWSASLEFAWQTFIPF